MWRYVVGGFAALLIASAGFIWFNGRAATAPALPPAPRMATADAPRTQQEQSDSPRAPAADERTREQKRFDRYDKDRNGAISRDEYLAARRKAYAKLDVDHDGKLSFDEWAIRSTTKFAIADADKSGTMTAKEFATTAVKRTQRRGCPAPAAADDRSDDS